MTLAAIGAGAMCGSDIALQVTESHSSPVSPPPYMAGAVEIELDPETGHVEILDYYAVVDCGTVINPNLARVQAEGGIVQGIGMTLYENISVHGKRTASEQFIYAVQDSDPNGYGKSACGI